jgi:pimeloyl-ACP methyl ester carboxylesterase
MAERVLIVPGSDRAGEARFLERVRASGAEVESITDTGYARMMRDDAYESVVPDATLDAIVAWIGEERYPPIPSPVSAIPAPSPLRVRSQSGAPTIAETPVLFGEGERLFGIVTEPERSVPSHRPALVLLNVGANSHVGPHRMNVELARELASRGYRTFRFDAAGLGDSSAAPGTRENRIYTKDAVGDAKAAMDLLGTMRGDTRFVLVGLCSGAYVAFHTAVVDPRVVGQTLLSPYAFEWSEGDPVAPTERVGFKSFRSTRFYARALFDRDVWKRALQGKVNVRGITGILLERARIRAEDQLSRLRARLRLHQRPQNEIERAFRSLCDRGVESLVVLSFHDGGVDMVARYLGDDARRMRGYKSFSLLILEGVDHTFQTLAAQQALREVLTNYLSTRFD